MEIYGKITGKSHLQKAANEMTEEDYYRQIAFTDHSWRLEYNSWGWWKFPGRQCSRCLLAMKNPLIRVMCLTGEGLLLKVSPKLLGRDVAKLISMKLSKAGAKLALHHGTSPLVLKTTPCSSKALWKLHRYPEHFFVVLADRKSQWL